MGNAPAVLDTIHEISAALDGNPNILGVLATNLSDAIGTEIVNRDFAISLATGQVMVPFSPILTFGTRLPFFILTFGTHSYFRRKHTVYM